MQFAVVDIETAGGRPQQGGITEIAVVIHDGNQIIDSYETLLNPETNIPTYITGLTGIDQAMVSSAPTFAEIAEELWELLEGRVFVAHQVNFDFGFIKEAFARLGKDFSPQKLCTVRLSRKIFPGYRSYSLGRICETRGIPILARHRAMGDARATAILFGQMMEENSDVIFHSLKRNSGERFLPPNFPKEKYQQIPEQCGVYYMLNEKGKTIYVGKAINIKERFKNHFSGNSLPSLKEALKAEVVDLKWELCGSEFFALLFETLEIKRLWPKYNSAMKRPKTLWGLFQFEDGLGFQRFQIAQVRKGLLPVETFFSRDEAVTFLRQGIQNHELCEKLCGLRKVSCNTEDSPCLGACHSAEPAEVYNSRLQDFVSKIKDTQKEILLKLEGRSEEEQLHCVFDRGILSKYAFVPQGEEKMDAKEFVTVPQIPETFYILRQFIHRIAPTQIQVLAS
ncbi:exonuclease domain-containing protein [Algoriphagus namhaensis]